jgi:TolA-binding protein
VEAVRDGQLAAPDSQAIASHVQVCMHCSSESERLTRIGDAVRQIPIREPSPLVVRIQRRKLLEEAAAQASPAATRTVSGRRKHVQPLRFALAAAAVVALAWVGLRHSSKTAEGPVALPAPSGDTTMVSSEVEVRATPESRWSQTSEPSVQLIALEQGVLWTKITHKRPHPPVVFRVPDGQIEDIGTTFTVSVRGGQTQRVAVEEGTVVVHLRGVNEMRMSSGEVWERSETGASGQARAGSVGPQTTAIEPSPNEQPAPQVEAPNTSASVAAPQEDPSSKPRGRATSKPGRRNPTAEESRLLKKGTAALHAGRFSEAVHLFERFEADFPYSGRAEDAAYLHALSLVRAGRSEEAFAAAKDYLARFPAGFRRTEMERYVSEVERSKH